MKKKSWSKKFWPKKIIEKNFDIKVFFDDFFSAENFSIDFFFVKHFSNFSTKIVFSAKMIWNFFDEKTFDLKILVTYSDPKFPQDSKNRT